MERVYPKLKEYCQSVGYDFQVVDMRWGVRDEATEDHMTSELCMTEIRACQKLSTGPNFIVSCLEYYQEILAHTKVLKTDWYSIQAETINPYAQQTVDCSIRSTRREVDTVPLSENEKGIVCFKLSQWCQQTMVMGCFPLDFEQKSQFCQNVIYFY